MKNVSKNWAIVTAVLVVWGGMLASPAAAQDAGEGGADIGPYADSTSGGLPHTNVTGGSLGGRTPGSWLAAAAARFGNQHELGYGGDDITQEPRVPRSRTFLLTFLPQAFDIINDLIQSYILAIQLGQAADAG